MNKKDSEILKLWVRAGGRCEYENCNEYLLEDEFTWHKVFLGDNAHIVARKRKGPRGEDPLPMQERDKAENLMLLCSEHHNKIIDKNKLLPEYPKERLLKMKKEHEDRIRHQTNWAPDRETAIICLTGKIRGDGVSISDEEIRKAVASTERYPKHFGVENVIRINLTGLPNEADWDTCKEKIDEVLARQILPALENREICHLSVIGLARIPVLIYLGHRLGDKIAIEIFQKHRDGDEGWIWRDEKRLSFKREKLAEGSDKTGLIVILSLSGRISPSLLPAEIAKKYTIYEIYPADCPPGRYLLSSRKTLDTFRKEYQALLRSIEQEHKGVENVHLFPAIPAPAAIICGREQMKMVSKSLMVYDRDGDSYAFTIKIK